jgi:hypothetical protein
MTARDTTYQLGRASQGMAFYGLTAAQVSLLAVAGLCCTALISSFGLAGGLMSIPLVLLCGALAFLPVSGRPSYAMVPVLARFAFSRLPGRPRWTAPLPLAVRGPQGATTLRSRAPGSRVTPLPSCLAGMEVHTVPRRTWAEAVVSDVGLVRDRRSGAMTAVLGVRGTSFGLTDQAHQASQLARWGDVLDQFAREISPVVRLGWSLWSAPAFPDEHVAWLEDQVPPGHPALGRYLALLDSEDARSVRHELRLWISVHPTGSRDRVADTGMAAVEAAASLTDRCVAAGLAIGDLLSPWEIVAAVRAQSDPAARPPSPPGGRGPADLPQLTSADPPIHLAPMAVENQWDAARVDGSWHRVLWVSHWPRTLTDPRWLEPLIVSPSCIRAISVSYEPISPRTSRRTITSEAVGVETRLRTRERYGLRAGVELQRAQEEVDRREAELVAGHTEYGVLTLVDVVGRDREELDASTDAIVDAAAQCGITGLRPLYGRQDAAWACTLPIGRAPDRELLRSIP